MHGRGNDVIQPEPGTSLPTVSKRGLALFWGVLVLVALGALVFRLPQLDLRPMHADESVQAAIFRDLWEKGTYRYNPDEFHGPTLTFCTLPSAWLSLADGFADTTESTFRIVPIAFAFGLILLLGLFADGLGRTSTIGAAVLAAVSPAMVYYSRYYIHETLLIFFTAAAIGCGWRYVRTRQLRWCVLTGVSLGLVQATKETSVIAFAAIAVALGLTWLWSWLIDRSSDRESTSEEMRGVGFQPAGRLVGPQGNCPTVVVHALVVVVVAILVALLLLTTFFTNPQGLVDSVGTYMPWLRRAGGESVHIHPWHFYLERLLSYQKTELPGLGKRAPFWSEGWILVLATIGLFASLWRGGRGVPDGSPALIRFLGFYAIVTAAAYTIIPYKTPWCLLNFWFPTILLAGVGVVAAIRWARWAPAAAALLLLLAALFAPSLTTTVLVAGAGGLLIVAVLASWLPRLVPRLLLGAALAAATVHLGWQAYRASYVFAADPSNPYVYAHTSPNLVRLHEKLEELAATSPLGHELPIQVVADDNYYWPLPWYLRKFDRHVISYSTEIPDDLDAPVVITATEHYAAIDAKLRGSHQMAGYYSLRPQVFLVLLVRKDVWKAHLTPESSRSANRPMPGARIDHYAALCY